MSQIVPFNPLDKKNLGASVADALLRSEVHPLGELPTIDGAGVYAIYYRGEFPAYQRLAQANSEECTVPIYVGKAIPAGARKGGGKGDSDAPSKSLVGRLRDHAKSVKAANDLDIRDFLCRYLVVDDIWIPLGESLLIARFAPVWNSLVDGFGNHTPGKGRFEGMRPRWDVLHPGRAWADKCAQRTETFDEIVRDVENYLRERLA
jgi:hypothetical protein